MLNMNSIEQEVRKYVEEPVIIWLDDCECKQQVSAVADLLKKFIITERDANNSKPGSTSRRNTKVDCETQTETNSRQRDCANTDKQEIVRRLEDKNGKLSILVEVYKWKVELMNEEMEHMLHVRSSHIHHIKESYEEENHALLHKIKDMRHEIISLKKRRPPLTERDTEEDTEDHQQNKRSDHTGRREAQWSEFTAGRRKICSYTWHSESKPVPVMHNRYEVLNNCYISEHANSDPVGKTSNEIISLKEHRPSPTERDNDDHTGRRGARGSSNGQQSANRRHRLNERDFGRKRNLAPRPHNRNLPPRLQNRNLPPCLQNRN